jgi:hypothetical protein
MPGENMHRIVGYGAASAHCHRKWISFMLSGVPEGRHHVANGACPERREGEAVGNKAGNGKKAPQGRHFGPPHTNVAHYLHTAARKSEVSKAFVSGTAKRIANRDAIGRRPIASELREIPDVVNIGLWSDEHAIFHIKIHPNA